MNNRPERAVEMKSGGLSEEQRPLVRLCCKAEGFDKTVVPDNLGLNHKIVS